MSTAAPVLKHLRYQVLVPVELEMTGKNLQSNFSIQRSCGSSRSLDSYHMSIPQLRECGSRNPYSLRTVRDRSVLTTDDEQYACGIDIKFPARKLQAFSNALVELVQTDPEYGRDVREIVYSPDGKTVLRWDAERGMDSEPRVGEGDDSHLWHTHVSQYRDAAKRMATAELIVRALNKAGLITAERMAQLLPEAPVNPEQVKLVQQALNSLGARLVVDGVFGPVTQKALAEVPAQIKNQLLQTSAALVEEREKGAASTALLAEVKADIEGEAASLLTVANKVKVMA